MEETEMIVVQAARMTRDLISGMECTGTQFLLDPRYEDYARGHTDEVPKGPLGWVLLAQAVRGLIKSGKMPSSHYRLQVDDMKHIPRTSQWRPAPAYRDEPRLTVWQRLLTWLRR